MFTGIVEACVPVRAFRATGQGARLVLPAPDLADWNPGRGASIAACGTCLTVAELEASEAGTEPGMVFELSRETLQRTWFGELAPGRMVNLERALRMGDRLDGHLVQGHVDGGAVIRTIEDVGDGGREFTFEVDEGLERYLVDKGSVTLDGISLTVVRPEGRRFVVAVIPLTLELTNLGSAEVGQAVNVEADVLGKWVERLLVKEPR